MLRKSAKAICLTIENNFFTEFRANISVGIAQPLRKNDPIYFIKNIRIPNKRKALYWR